MSYERERTAPESTGVDRLPFALRSWPKKQEARSFLTGLLIGWIKLKDRSAGGWRSGMQRSEK
jgi:hypothetical protein